MNIRNTFKQALYESKHKSGAELFQYIANYHKFGKLGYKDYLDVMRCASVVASPLVQMSFKIDSIIDRML